MNITDLLSGSKETYDKVIDVTSWIVEYMVMSML